MHQGVHVHPVEQGRYIQLPQERVEVHALDEPGYVYSLHQRGDIDLAQDVIDVDLIEQGVRIDPADECVDIQRAHDEVDRALGDPLGNRLHRVRHSFPCRQQPVARIHEAKYRCCGIPRIIRQG